MPTDTANHFCVSLNADSILCLRPIPQRMTKGEALNLAAWLVAMADDHDDFPALLDAVQNT